MTCVDMESATPNLIVVIFDLFSSLEYSSSNEQIMAPKDGPVMANALTTSASHDSIAETRRAIQKVKKAWGDAK